MEGVLSRAKVPLDHGKFPYINNSGVDVAGKVLRHLKPGLKDRDLDWRDKGELIKFDQKEFEINDKSDMNEFGYVYVPEKCLKK